MTCEIKRLPDGGRAIVCTRGRAARRCRWCPRASSKLCDHQVGQGTCDAPLCALHATPNGPNLDLCPDHKECET